MITKERVVGVSALVLAVAVSMAGPAAAQARTGNVGPAGAAAGGKGVSLRASSPGPDTAPALSPVALPGDTCAQARADRARLAREGKRQVLCTDGATTTTATKAAPATTMRAAATVTASAVPSWCPSGSWAGYRDKMCTTWSSTLRLYDPKTNQTTGGINVAVSQYMTLMNNSTTVTEDFEMRFSGGWGQIQGVTVSVATWCPGACTATGPLTRVPVVNGGTQQGTAVYTVTPAGTVTTQISYGAQFFGPGGPGDMSTWTGPNFRCDNVLPGRIGPGCVVPWYTPTMTSMASLPYTAAGIRAIQAAGGYGVQGRIPLQRAVDPIVRDANRAAACAGKTPPPGTDPSLTYCDEYPFATTYQGAAFVPPPGSGITWVNQAESDAQGGYIQGFYVQNRVLNGDQFWVWV